MNISCLLCLVWDQMATCTLSQDIIIIKKVPDFRATSATTSMKLFNSTMLFKKILYLTAFFHLIKAEEFVCLFERVNLSNYWFKLFLFYFIG